jgi:hypothetical protein
MIYSKKRTNVGLLSAWNDPTITMSKNFDEIVCTQEQSLS